MMASPEGSRPRGHERALRISVRVYQLLTRAYPYELQDDYGDEMVRCFRDLCRDELQNGGTLGLAALWAHILPELLHTGLKKGSEKMYLLNRNTYRSTVGVAFVTGLILLIPLIAMQITDEVVWHPFDFAVAGALLFGTGCMFVLIARKAGKTAYRAATCVALSATLLLVWMNLAVGIIGPEGNLANSMYIGVLAVGIIGAIIARFQPHGMARALLATALAQALVALIAVIAELGSPSPLNGPGEILVINGFFVALWTGSALLFRNAAQEHPPADARSEA